MLEEFSDLFPDQRAYVLGVPDVLALLAGLRAILGDVAWLVAVVTQTWTALSACGVNVHRSPGLSDRGCRSECQSRG